MGLSNIASACRMETQLWAFEVYMRKGKLLLALSAMRRALAIAGPSDPTAHGLVVRFALRAQDSSRPVRLPHLVACIMQEIARSPPCSCIL